MAKATPEELAMHESAKNDETTLAQLADQLENGNGAATDNTASGDQAADTVQPKRKRGRPSNAEKALQESIEKETPGAATAETPTANKPGRKPGKSVKPTGAALGKQLVGIHALAAMMLQIPEVQLREDEGEQLGNAIVAVCEEYNLSVSGKTGAAIQLLAAAAMIYAPRAFVIKARIDANRAAAQAAADQQGASLHVIHPGPTSTN